MHNHYGLLTSRESFFLARVCILKSPTPWKKDLLSWGILNSIVIGGEGKQLKNRGAYIIVAKVIIATTKPTESHPVYSYTEQCKGH